MKLTRRDVIIGAGMLLGSTVVAQAATRRNEFDLEEVTLVIPSLDPAHEGLRVAQLSDVHTGRMTPDGRVIAAVRAVNAAKPELVVLTGDYVSYRFDPIERVPDLLGGIEAPTFAVLGNHDHWTQPLQLRRGLEGVGYAVLQNEHTTVQVRGSPLCVLGVDDGYTRNDDVARTLRGAPSSGTRLVLAHTPSTAAKLPEGAGLPCFSGHTHGGQVMLAPKVTSAVLKLTGEPFVRGRYDVGGNVLYVNRGLGLGRGSPAPRIQSTPEVTVFTLTRGV